MIRHALGAAAAVLFLASSPVAAEEVKTPRFDGLTLNANLELAPGGNLAQGVTLIVHDTFGHAKAEPVAGLQRRLAARGVNSLAVTISLEIDDRAAPLACGETNDHRHFRAIDEIEAWLGWLADREVGPVSLMGFGRGANQAAVFLAEERHSVVRAVLAAPMTWNFFAESAAYRERWGVDLIALFARSQRLMEYRKGGELYDVPAFLGCPDPKVTVETFQSYHGDDPSFDTPQVVPAIPVPVLVVVPGSDQKLMARVDDMRAAANAQVEIVDGADRDFTAASADRLADLVAGFVGK